MTSESTQSTKARSRISSERKVDLISQKPALSIVKNRASRKNWLSNQFNRLHSNSIQSSSNLWTFDKNFSMASMVWVASSVLCWVGLGVIFFTIHPENIANIFLYQSYLPVLALFFTATFCLAKALFIHSRKSVLLGLFCTLLLFLKFQSVVIDWIVILVMIVLFSLVELIISLVFRK